MKTFLAVVYVILSVLLITSVSMQRAVVQHNTAVKSNPRPVDRFLSRVTIALSCVLVVINIIMLSI